VRLVHLSPILVSYVLHAVLCVKVVRFHRLSVRVALSSTSLRLYFYREMNVYRVVPKENTKTVSTPQITFVQFVTNLV